MIEYPVIYNKRILGNDMVELGADDKLNIRIKIGDAWTDLLDIRVPNRKAWQTNVIVKIDERDI